MEAYKQINKNDFLVWIWIVIPCQYKLSETYKIKKHVTDLN